MTTPEIEVQVTGRIRDAIKAATDKVGDKDFAALSGLDREALQDILGSQESYVRVTVVTLACQINKSHGISDSALSSVSECLKGALYRVPSTQPSNAQASMPRRTPVRFDELKSHRRSPTFLDQKSARILSLTGNVAGFLILGYFLGGILLAPLLGLQQCIGVASTPPWGAPCLGSGLGLAMGSIIGLIYTYYYFVKKM